MRLRTAFCMIALSFGIAFDAAAQPREGNQGTEIPDIRRPGLGEIPGLGDGVDLRDPLPLHPNRFISTRYLWCNALQVHLMRRSVWEPTYIDLGIEDRAIDRVEQAYETLARHLCLGTVNSAQVDHAAMALRQVHGRMEKVLARAMGTSLEDAIDVRVTLQLAELEALKAACFRGPEREARLLLQRWPMTPDIGLGLEAGTPSRVLGQCGGGRGFGQTSRRHFDLAAMQSCLDSFAEQYEQCVSPVGDVPEGFEAALDECNSSPHCSGTENPDPDSDGGTKGTMTFEDSAGNTWKVTYNKDANGVTTRVTGHVQRAGGRVITVNYTEPALDAAVREIADDIRSVSPITEAVDEAFDQVADAINPTGGEEGQRMLEVLKDIFRINIRTGGGGQGGAGGGNLCTAINPVSQTPVGYNRPSGVRPPIGPGNIAVEDVLGYCLCQSGRFGREMANTMGVGCGGRDPWLERMQCLANPLDQFDRVRPECLRYLLEDNGYNVERHLTGICSATVQCPEGANLVEEIGREISCRCHTPPWGDGGAGGRHPICNTVICGDPAQPGMFGLYQECCEGEGPPLPQ